MKLKIHATECHGEKEKHRALLDLLCGPHFSLCGPLWANDIPDRGAIIGFG